jgi:CheY-like chemotaxis protein
LQRRLDRGDTNIQRYIDGAIEGAERAARLTKRLLAFSRQQPLSPEIVDCNKLISGMSELLRRTIPENVAIETVAAGGLWRTHVDANELENSILNLVVNARDAMPEGGKLTIETANAHLDESYSSANSEVTTGQYIMIAVTETGAGMSPEVAERVFDRFFTTKPPGQGTGLGLSQVHGFIKHSRGHIKVYSEVDVGTAVKLYLPRYFGSELPAAELPVTKLLLRARNNETLLVVEDESDVRKMTVEMVMELGYVALEASSGAVALQILEKHPEVKLLITDVVMPEMNGRQLAEEAVKRRPDIRVLFTTGYTRNAIVHRGTLDPDVHLITKPHTLERLSAKIDELLYAS